MRMLLNGCLASLIGVAASFGAGCAQEHDFSKELRPRGTQSEDPVYADDRDADTPTDIEGPTGPHRVAGEAGVLPPVAKPSFDASAPDAAPRRDAGTPYDATPADADQPDSQVDAGPPPFRSATGKQATLPTFEGPCESTPPAPAPDPSCRSAAWHAPPCFATPLACEALHESTTCLSLDADGTLVFTGLDTGATCRSVAAPQYSTKEQLPSFARLGPDLFTVEGGAVVKHSIVDGSFDVANGASNAMFVQGDKLLVHRQDGTLVRYASWDDLKNDNAGEVITNLRSPQATGVFGASSKNLVVVWPRGYAELLLDGTQRLTFPLTEYDSDRDGPVSAVDVSDDGKLFLLTDRGIWIYDLETGALISRLATGSLWGLECEPGYAADAVLPTEAGEARPGFASERKDPILTSDNCAGPFNGPRYFGDQSGPELLVIGTFFHGQNQVQDNRTAPHVLALTSVESTQWSVVVAAGSGIERILINGSASQVTVQSPTPVPIEYHTDANSLGTHPGNWPTLEESTFRANLEAYVGRPVTEILGCHFGSSYVVNDVPPLCMAP